MILGKTTNLSVKVEEELKEQAEVVLGHLGIPLSNAINIFLKQVVVHKGLPFEVKVPFPQPIEVPILSEVQLNTELEKGISMFAQGNPESDEKIFITTKKD